MQALADKYADRDVYALVVNVLEGREKATAWAEHLEWTIPVLLDDDGMVAESYAPADVLPDLPRNQIPIAGNLLIDREGRVQFYSLLDSRNFDAKLIALRTRLDELLAVEEE